MAHLVHHLTGLKLTLKTQKAVLLFSTITTNKKLLTTIFFNMYLDEEIFNSEYNERVAKERAQSYMKLKNGYKEPNDKHSHYDNTNGSLYLFAKQKELNAWEFDIIKRIVRCRKKGQFESDLKKTIDVINLYLKEYDTTPKN